MQEQPPQPSTQNPAPAKSGVPWSPGIGVLFIVALFFLSQVVAGILISVYPLLQHWSHTQTNNWLTNSVTAQFIYVLLAEGLTVWVIYLWLKRHGRTFAAIGLKRPRWKDAGYGLLYVPVYYGLYLLLLGAATSLTKINVNQQQDVGFNGVHGMLPLVLTFISLVVLPPITEEIMMRGFLYGSLKKALPALQAALLTSLIFASAHLPEGGGGGPLWVAAVDTFTLSLVLCYLREKTGSLWAGITLHGLKNGVAFVALFLLHAH